MSSSSSVVRVSRSRRSQVWLKARGAKVRCQAADCSGVGSFTGSVILFPPLGIGPAYLRSPLSDHNTVNVGGEDVRVSSPDRVIFPRQGWTKLDVIEHFVVVAEGAIRGIRGRPTMLKRYMR